MRRSSAPSNSISRPLKRAKFTTPFRDMHINVKDKDDCNTNCEFDEVDLAKIERLAAVKENITSNEINHVNKAKADQMDGKSYKSRYISPVSKAFCNKLATNTVQNHENILGNDSQTEFQKDHDRYFNVVWCKISKKKHKKWDGDGILVVSGRNIVLKDMDGKNISQTSNYKSSELTLLSEGETLVVGGKEIEVMNEISKEDFASGRCFYHGSSEAIATISSPKQSKALGKRKLSKANGCFINPMSSGINQSNITFKKSASLDGPRHNPDAVGAIVMPRPAASHQWEHNEKGRSIIDVVIDPFIATHLRPHQITGVTFLYKCIMGMGGYNGNGAILADEMGLGKTLQCITLIWTLLKQGPYGGKPTLKRILVVTPGSLVKNWCAEFQKWLGDERIRTFPVSSDRRVEEFSKSIVYPVMIVSYEMLLRCLADVKTVKFDMILCDEAHRLKNFGRKTSMAITGLGIRKMVLLTGTPIQNDLKEFFALGELCNPGIFGTAATFQRVFEGPINKSQEPGCSLEEKEIAACRSAELRRLTDQFVLRRTSEVNKMFLPPKVELVVLCKLSPLQQKIYNQMLNSRTVRSCMSAYYDGSQHLVCISALKKLCNHPSLLYTSLEDTNIRDDAGRSNDEGFLYDGLLELYPENYGGSYEGSESGKLIVLENLIAKFKEENEKCVIVSNSTKTLDIFEKLFIKMRREYLRLDGKTPTQERQRLVDRFNSVHSNIDAFLLSSKAGGTGLNLIGASRLILYDIDWNPANDIQAMARVWRDGQKKKVFIYRLLSTGTIEEKVYQRQVAKQGLSGHVVDMKTDKVRFSSQDLKDLFRFQEDTISSTHDLLECSCHEDVEIQDNKASEPKYPSCELGQPRGPAPKSSLSMAELMSWNHIRPENKDKISDNLLQQCLDNVSFVFQNESKTA